MEWVNLGSGSVIRRATGLKLFVLAGALSMIGLADTSKAALTLTLMEPGFATVTITDASEGTPGTVTDFLPYGDFTTNIVIGTDNKNSPSSVAQMQIQSIDVKNTANVGKTLTVMLSDTGFTFPGTAGSPLSLTGGLGGTLTLPGPGDSVSFQSTATPAFSTASSTTFNTFSPTPNAAAVGVVTFSVPTASVNFTQSTSFDLSSTIVATLSGAGETANLSGSATVTAVPEPASISLFGLTTVGLLARRRIVA